MACSALSHNLNQCWFIVNWNLMNKIQWNFNRNSNIFIEENAFEKVVSNMASILCRSQYVKHNKPVTYAYFLGYTGNTSHHYNDVIISVMVTQITSLTIVYSTVYSGADQRKYQSSASLAFVRGIHRWAVNSPHKGPVTRKMFPFDDVIMCWRVHDYIKVCKT